ncbi:MAG: glycosyltransferase family 4 protein [Bacteroidia bacterium]|nr:glycosyltransferase family 4 protein [Bacteroidia bacterium]
MPTLRILHLAHVINKNDFIDTIVRYLPRDRFKMEVATFQATSNIADPAYEKEGIPHHILPVPHPRAYYAYLRAAYQLSHLLRKREIHILHTHHYWEGIVGALVKKLRPSVRLVVHRHYTEDITRLRYLQRKIMLSLEKWTYCQSDAIVVPTQTISDFMQKTHNKYFPNIHIIPYGFNLHDEKYKPLSPEERAIIRKKYEVSENTLVIGNFASHRHQKGQHLLLRAFARLHKEKPDTQLWLVGEGPETPLLRRMARELGLDEPPAAPPCRFLGWKKAAEVRQLLGATDIVAHPTFSEAFPQLMVEALALERALIITSVSGVKEWLTSGEHALIISIGQEEALFHALYTLSENTHLRTKLGTQGRAHALAHFEYPIINPRYESLYTALCSQ